MSRWARTATVGAGLVLLASTTSTAGAVAGAQPAPVRAPLLSVVVKAFPWLDGGRRVASHGTTIGTIRCPRQASPPVLYTADRGTQASYVAAPGSPGSTGSTGRPEPAVQVFRFASDARARRAYAGLRASARECQGHRGSGAARVERSFVTAPTVGRQRFAYLTQGGQGAHVSSAQVDVYAQTGDLLEVSTVTARRPFAERLYDALAADLEAANG